MPNIATLIFTTDSTVGNLSDVFVHTNPNLALSNMQNYLAAIVSGSASASVNVKVNTGTSTVATKTVTVLTPVPGHILSVNGLDFVADTDFDIGASNTATAANIANAINATANPLVYSLVSATSLANVVTLTARTFGSAGNMITVEGGDTLAPSGVGTAASGTFTIVNGVETDTVEINGIVFTAVDDGNVIDPTDWELGANDTAAAVNLKNIINAHAELGPLILATSALGVVTLTAKEPGVLGNNITLAATGGNIAESAATLTGGASTGLSRLTGGGNDTSSVTYNFGR